VIAGAPEQARWICATPRRSLPADVLDRIVNTAFPGSRVVSCEPLAAGLRNANFKLGLDNGPGPAVLRVYEHDPSLCRKEIDLARLVRGSVPTPEILYAAPDGVAGVPPYAIMRWEEGITFHELKRSGDGDAVAQAARAAGEVLAAIGRFAFSRPGWIAPGPAVTAPLLDGADAMPRFIDLCLAAGNLQRRVPDDLRHRTRDFVWRCAPLYGSLESEAHLVHGDFNKRDLLVRRRGGQWTIAAVLDWEFAVSGSPLADIGSFLRYERQAQPLIEPHFCAGCQSAGGKLQDGWRRLARLLNLVALCESLTHDSLPPDVSAELIELVRFTIEESRSDGRG